MKNLVRLTNIVKSKSDKREYLVKMLPNELKCLLISDMEADKSSASVCVNAGSLLDPKEFSGLAHFCEHMLFMGTEKYPKENDFSQFLNQHSGHSNAYTALDRTNYFFQVSNEAFIPTIDRFAQFFIKPLFNESSVEREMQQVDSEHKKNLQSDLWRMMQLQRSQVNRYSYFNCFSTGNLHTLNKPNIREELLNYHSTYYSSHLMGMVMLSNLPLSKLESITDDLFTQIPKKPKTHLPNYMNVEPYDESNLGYLYKVIPVTNKDELTITWYINDQGKDYHAKPLKYISSVLGHEGQDSVLSSLMKDNLVTGLTSGYDIEANSYTEFYIHVQLTKKGLSEWEDVMKRIVYMIKHIRKNDLNRQFFDEMQNIAQLTFDYKGKEEPSSYCSHLSANFKTYEMQDILTGDYLIHEYNEKLIKDFMNLLQLKNMNVYLCSKEFTEDECNKTEPIYGTKFNKYPFPALLVTYFKARLHEFTLRHKLDYPPPNLFLPKSMDLFVPKNKEIHPKLIQHHPNNRVWYKQDSKFNLPKAIVYLQIYFNAREYLTECETDTISHIWSKIIENALREINYMASEAKINFDFNFNNEGLKLSVNGFNSSIYPVFIELVKMFKNIGTEDKQAELATQIERFSKNINNFYYSAPYSQALTFLEKLLVDPSSNPEDKLKIANNLSLGYLDKFVKNFTHETSMEWLIQGNITEEEALKISNDCCEIIRQENLAEDRYPVFRVANIQERYNYYFTLKSKDINNKNSAIVSYFEFGNLSMADNLKLYIIDSILSEPFFDELRTKQTLGYIVKLFSKKVRKISSMCFIVQSSVKSPEYIWQQINTFIKESTQKMNELSDEDFTLHVNSVLNDIKQKDLKLSDEFSRNLNEIKNRDYEFDKKEKSIEALSKITKKEVIDLFEKHLVNNTKRLDVEILANNHEDENDKLEKENNDTSSKDNIKRIRVISLSDFKKRTSMYPDLTYNPRF